MNSIKKILPLILFFLMIILLGRGLSLHPTLVPSPLVNKSAPNFELPTLFDEKKITSNHDLFGHVTLLNIWATWCIACAEEHAFLMELAQKKQFVLYGLNYKDNPAAAKKWLKQYGNPYQRIAIDPKGTAAIDWGVYGTPETFIIDQNGIIRYKQIGPITAAVWEKTLRPIVEKLKSRGA